MGALGALLPPWRCYLFRKASWGGNLDGVPCEEWFPSGATTWQRDTAGSQPDPGQDHAACSTLAGGCHLSQLSLKHIHLKVTTNVHTGGSPPATQTQAGDAKTRTCVLADA